MKTKELELYPKNIIEEEVISLIKKYTVELEENGKINVSSFSFKNNNCSFLLNLKDEAREKSYYSQYLSKEEEPLFHQFFHFLFLLKNKEEMTDKLTTIELLNHSFLTKFKFNDVEIVKQRENHIRRISYHSPIIKHSSIDATITLNENNEVIFSEILFNIYKKCRKGKQPFLIRKFSLNTYQIFNNTRIILKDSSSNVLNSFEVFGSLFPCLLDKIISKASLEINKSYQFSLLSFYTIEQIIKIEEELVALFNICLETIPFQENFALTRNK